MSKKLLLAVLFLIVSSVCFGGDFIEIGVTMIWNPVVFDHPNIGGGINLAVLPKITDHFGLGLFFNLAFAPSSFLFDFLLGLHFEFNIKDKIFIIPSVGAYMGIISFGLGGNITVQYALHPNIALFARMQYAYATFLAPGVNSVKTSVVSPSIGIGYRL